MLMLLKIPKTVIQFLSLLIAGLKECHWHLHYLMIQILSGRSIATVIKEVLQTLKKEIFQHLMRFSLTSNIISPQARQTSNNLFHRPHQEPPYSLCFTAVTHYSNSHFNY